MKMKKVIAAVLAAVLVAANMSVTAFADTGAPKLTFLSDAADSLKQRSNLTVTAASGNGSGPAVTSPSDSDKETGNQSGSDADRIVSAAPGKIVLPNELGADMEGKFRELLESDENKTVLLNIAKTIVEEHEDEIAQLFEGEDVDEIKVFVEVELEQVEMEDDGRYVQCALYSVVPKACGFRDGSVVSTKNLDCGYQMGDRHMIVLAIPEDYIDKAAGEEGAYVTRDVVRGKLSEGFPFYAYRSWDVPVSDDFGGFGEALIVPSQYEIFDHKYYQDEGDVFWVGIKSLPVGAPVEVSFNGYLFDGIEVGPVVSEYLDCKMEPDGDSMIITGKKSTEGALAMFYLVRKLKGGLEFKQPFLVEVVDAPQSSGGSSSSSDEGSSYSASSSEPESSGGWVAGEKGWWYRFEDGTYPAGGWMPLEWQGKTGWYYFGAEGYMTSGWLTDADGNRYFLHDKMDGTQGYMYTGWHLIDGKWYYFSEVTGGPFGSLLVNTTTPDGYYVGADGVWIP